jgi:hypothetical protein
MFLAGGGAAERQKNFWKFSGGGDQGEKFKFVLE